MGLHIPNRGEKVKQELRTRIRRMWLYTLIVALIAVGAFAISKVLNHNEISVDGLMSPPIAAGCVYDQVQDGQSPELTAGPEAQKAAFIRWRQTGFPTLCGQAAVWRFGSDREAHKKWEALTNQWGEELLDWVAGSDADQSRMKPVCLGEYGGKNPCAMAMVWRRGNTVVWVMTFAKDENQAWAQLLDWVLGYLGK